MIFRDQGTKTIIIRPFFPQAPQPTLPPTSPLAIVPHENREISTPATPNERFALYLPRIYYDGDDPSRRRQRQRTLVKHLGSPHCGCFITRVQRVRPAYRLYTEREGEKGKKSSDTEIDR